MRKDWRGGAATIDFSVGEGAPSSSKARSQPAEDQLKQLLRERDQRVKELTCLHHIARLADEPARAEEETLQGIVNLLPSAYRHPEKTHARFSARDMQFSSPHFEQTAGWISVPVVVFGGKAGTLDMFLPDPIEGSAGEVGFRENDMFLRTVAEYVGRIVERKRSAVVLHNAMRKLRDFKSIVNRSPAVVVLWRAIEESPVEFVSENIKQFGYTANELISGRIAWQGIVHPDDRERIYKELVEHTSRGERGFTREYRLITRSGAVRWVEDRTVALRDVEGFLDYYQGIILDITEQQELRERLLVQATALEAAGNGILFTEPDGTIVSVNAAFTRLTGYTADEAIGRNPRLLKSGVHGRDYYRAMWNTITSGRTWTGELVNKRKDGTLYHEEKTITPVVDQRGRVTQFMAIMQDVSARKRAERALMRKQTKLQALASELSLAEEHERRRLAAILHDHIGQLLAACDLKLGRLSASASPGAVTETIQSARVLIDQAIQETRSLTFELSPPILYELGLAAAVEDLCAQLEKQYGFSLLFEDDRKEKPVAREVGVLLFRAARELLFNIAKHAEARHGRVAMTAKDGLIRIAIEDDGVGFDPSELGDSFSRTGGFGLFNLRERICHAGGHLEVRSAIGRGTRVVVTAPLLTGNGEAAG